MSLIYFAGSAAAGIIGWATIFATIIWPRLRQQPRVQQLKTLTTIHFFRYFATTLLIAGLVSHKLPSGFADPAAFGDLISLGLAYVAFIGLQRSRAGRPSLLPVWIFNIVGAADLVVAMVLGPVLIRDPGDFGLSYIIPTVYVPLLLVAHFYALRVLSQRSAISPRPQPRRQSSPV
jgi:VanZ family protein